MAKKLYEESSISAIADAIREVGLVDNTYTVSQMAQAILDFKAGVQIPPVLHELVINAAGIYTPETGGWDGFSRVKVNVTSGGLIGFESAVSARGSVVNSEYSLIELDDLNSTVSAVVL